MGGRRTEFEQLTSAVCRPSCPPTLGRLCLQLVTSPPLSLSAFRVVPWRPRPYALREELPMTSRSGTSPKKSQNQSASTHASHGVPPLRDVAPRGRTSVDPRQSRRAPTLGISRCVEKLPSTGASAAPPLSGYRAHAACHCQVGGRCRAGDAVVASCATMQSPADFTRSAVADRRGSTPRGCDEPWFNTAAKYTPIGAPTPDRAPPTGGKRSCRLERRTRCTGTAGPVPDN